MHHAGTDMNRHMQAYIKTTQIQYDLIWYWWQQLIILTEILILDAQFRHGTQEAVSVTSEYPQDGGLVTCC